jgi:hypothetical protein
MSFYILKKDKCRSICGAESNKTIPPHSTPAHRSPAPETFMRAVQQKAYLT